MSSRAWAGKGTYGPNPGAASHRKIRWRRADSNRRPPACKAGALPTELRPRADLRKRTRALTHTARRADKPSRHEPRRTGHGHQRTGPLSVVPALAASGERQTPSFEVQWQLVERGHWEARCQMRDRSLLRAARRPSHSARPARPIDLAPRGAVRAPGHERSRSAPGHLEGSGRPGRRLLVGGVQRLRLRLAGFPLRRGKRRVTTNPPSPDPPSLVSTGGDDAGGDWRDHRLRGLGFPTAWVGAFLALSWLFPSFELYGGGEKPRRRRFAWAFFTFVALP